MKTSLTFLTIAFLALWLADCSSPKASATAAPGSSPLATDRAKALNSLKKSLAGKENWPADSVFTQVKMLKKVPVHLFLTAMDKWGETLGVGCDHCHVPNEWASEVKPEKETTRQMVALVNKINADLRELDLQGVSCYTCHRGEIDPARKAKE